MVAFLLQRRSEQQQEATVQLRGLRSVEVKSRCGNHPARNPELFTVWPSAEIAC